VSKPQNKNYSITVFVVEGLKIAIKVMAGPSGITQRRARFETPEAALAWCRKHGAGLVYSPSPQPAHN